MADPENPVFRETGAVDHEANRQSVRGEPARDAQATQSQDVADRGIPEVEEVEFQVGLEVLVGGCDGFGGDGRGRAKKRVPPLEGAGSFGA